VIDETSNGTYLKWQFLAKREEHEMPETSFTGVKESERTPERATK